MKYFLAMGICVLSLLMVSCSKQETPSKSIETSKDTEVAGMDETNTNQTSTVTPTKEELLSTIVPTTGEEQKITGEPTKSEESTKDTASKDESSKTLNQTALVPTLSPDNFDPTAEISYEIPEKLSLIHI